MQRMLKLRRIPFYLCNCVAENAFAIFYANRTLYIYLYKEFHRDPGSRFVDSKSALHTPGSLCCRPF